MLTFSPIAAFGLEIDRCIQATCDAAPIVFSRSFGINETVTSASIACEQDQSVTTHVVVND